MTETNKLKHLGQPFAENIWPYTPKDDRNDHEITLLGLLLAKILGIGVSKLFPKAVI